MPSVDSQQWRERVLARVMRGTALLGTPLAVFTLVYPRFRGSESWTTPLHTLMLVCFALACTVGRWGWGPRGTAAAWVTLMGACVTSAMLSFGLAPAILLAQMLLVVVTGGLLGRRAGVLALALASASLVGAGAAFELGWVEPLIPLYRTDSMEDWIRAAFEMAIVGASISVLLDSVVRENEQQERMLAEQARLEALGTLAGGVAHDINNTLQIVAFSADLLADIDAPEAKAIASNLSAAGDRARGLMQRLMAIDPSASSTPEDLDVARAVRDWCATMGSLVPSDVELVVRAPESAWVRVDRVALEQVLLNLVVNARDAVARGRLGGAGRIEVRVVADDREVVLTVADDGPGIPSSIRATLLEPFVSGEGEPGRGLGLAIVRAAVQSMGGRIEVTSGPQGASFAVRVPAISPPEGEEDERPEVDENGRGEGVRVLVAEDDAAIRRALVSTLRREGFDVIEAADSDEAWGLLRAAEAPIDALCTDAVMPGRPIVELIAEFRERCPDGKVVLCSGHMPQDLVLRGLDGIHMLRKPFKVRELVAALASGTERSGGPGHPDRGVPVAIAHDS